MAWVLFPMFGVRVFGFFQVYSSLFKQFKTLLVAKYKMYATRQNYLKELSEYYENIEWIWDLPEARIDCSFYNTIIWWLYLMQSFLVISQTFQLFTGKSVCHGTQFFTCIHGIYLLPYCSVFSLINELSPNLNLHVTSNVADNLLQTGFRNISISES